ncbi:MAG TPA: alkaline phosphatase family protein [Steroidobacteraceae bacterium]|nr:alkaline phosphatase family protein [Steroidobacteraceae bacterium]
MRVSTVVAHTLRSLRATALSLAMIQMSLGPTPAAAAQASNDLPSPGNLGNPRSPIQHVIIVIGENRSFDHVFATYQPTAINGRPQEVLNLLSEGIVSLQGTTAVPGPNWQRAVQRQVATQRTEFVLSPPSTDYVNLPNPLAGGPAGQYANLTGFCTSLAQCTGLAEAVETGLPDPASYASLASGGTGLTAGTPDTRIQWASGSVADNDLLPGPFQLTSAALPYTAYAASPVHRFYQMQQQLNCQPREWDSRNPSGCDGKLFAWVETTFGAGSNGNLPGYSGTPNTADDKQTGTFATNYTTGESPAPVTTGEGSTALGFYNVQQGDAPYFKQLADTYAMSDNFHQSFQGGTGANHIMLGHGDALYFQDEGGNAIAPPNPVSNPHGALSEIENPNPDPAAISLGSNNWYTEDGYGSFDKAGSDYFGGGTYSDCSDPTQPGVQPVLSHIHGLGVASRCEPGHYYLLNNYNPGYEPQLSNEDASTFNGTWQDAYYQDYAVGDGATAFTIPPNRNGNGKDPSRTNSIGDTLNNAGISWKYYGDQLNVFHTDPHVTNSPAKGQLPDEYCQICNPFQYDQSIMESPDVNKHIQDSTSLYADIASGANLPAVSFVKPSGLVDGHPASSKLDLFEGFVRKIVDEIQSSAYANNTAIFITFDEGGGYYDSGYVQPLDFFGDGTRIPLIVVAPTQYLKGAGYISHQYADHVSILKFIERNWRLPRVTSRSRDNLPSPRQLPVERDFRGFVDTSGYVPYVDGVAGRAAIADLWDFFNFPSSGGSW